MNNSAEERLKTSNILLLHHTFTTEWLSERIASLDPNWNPNFAMPSAVNWVNALDYEIGREHGSTSNVQFASCKTKFSGNVSVSSVIGREGDVFGPMFHSLTFALSLRAMSQSGTAPPWTFPNAVVTWYYAVYHAMRAPMLVHRGNLVETHLGTANALTDLGLRSKFPHPLNVVAIRSRGVTYYSMLPDYRGASTYGLIRSFVPSRPVAQGMLLEYMNGTADFWVEYKRQKLREQGMTSFRSLVERNRLYRSVRREYNFLHSAYRYRGKANYRDGLFLTYGQPDPRLNQDYVGKLANIARFVWVSCLAYLELSVGRPLVEQFLSDLDANLRGKELVAPGGNFWTSL